MMKEQLLCELDASTEILIKTLSCIDSENVNRQPAAGGWSAVQVAEHLLILETIANKVVRGETIKSTRASDEKIPLIIGAMMDTDTKRVAPDVVLPSQEPGDLQAIVRGLQKQRELLKEAIISTDLSEACISLKHPALGTLTRLEWIWFTIHHTRRHIIQIEQLLKECKV